MESLGLEHCINGKAEAMVKSVEAHSNLMDGFTLKFCQGTTAVSEYSIMYAKMDFHHHT